jgi:hypothetical protein
LTGRMAALRPLAPKGSTELDVRVAAWNLREMYELKTLFTSIQKAAPYRLQIVQIQSHANPTPVISGRTYGSNMEVSRNRGDRVQQLVFDLWRDTGLANPEQLAFMPVPVADQDSFLDEDPTRWANAVDLEKKLSAELKVYESVASADELTRASMVSPPMTLLDYTYFMIYTVSTTGYGDIAPISMTAKFIVSMANLFELFFIVIVFNAIFALRSPQVSLAARLSRIHRLRAAIPPTPPTNGGPSQGTP